MILCKCGKAFSDIAWATDHLTISIVFGTEKDHGIVYQDQQHRLSSEVMQAVLASNYNFINAMMRGEKR